MAKYWERVWEIKNNTKGQLGPALMIEGQLGPALMVERRSSSPHLGSNPRCPICSPWVNCWLGASLELLVYCRWQGTGKLILAYGLEGGNVGTLKREGNGKNNYQETEKCINVLILNKIKCIEISPFNFRAFPAKLFWKNAIQIAFKSPNMSKLRSSPKFSALFFGPFGRLTVG